ncbi:hypothetical protein [Aeromonas dhakensis]|uniref:hypothetical protein n=1 Tax=Aeromonas dhakensis TaxID=196024 RepID=UPI0038D2077D
MLEESIAMALDVNAMLKAVFEPFESRVAHEVPGGIGPLKTADLPEELREESFSRFRKVKISSEDVVSLSNGDFFTYFKCGDEYYLCISTQYLTPTDIDKINVLLEDYLCVEHYLEECFFMHFTSFIKDYYTIRSALDNNAIIETLGLGAREYQSTYAGHDINELIGLYTPVKIFSIDPDSALLDKDSWFLASLIVISCDSVKSKVIDETIVSQAKDILDLGSVNLENVYLSLTASHHKYIFIEIYRCLEAIYYLPCMLDLKAMVNLTCDAFDLARSVAKSLAWKEKERDSINSLFKNVPYQLIVDSSVLSLPFVAALAPADSIEFKIKLSNLIYNIRNQSVHQEDYEEIARININSKGWVCISRLVYMVVNYLYRQHSADIKVYNCKFLLNAA